MAAGQEVRVVPLPAAPTVDLQMLAMTPDDSRLIVSAVTNRADTRATRTARGARISGSVLAPTGATASSNGSIAAASVAARPHQPADALAERTGQDVRDLDLRVLVAAAVAAMTVAVTTWVEGDGSGDLPALVDHALSLIDTDEPTA